MILNYHTNGKPDHLPKACCTFKPIYFLMQQEAVLALTVHDLYFTCQITSDRPCSGLDFFQQFSFSQETSKQAWARLNFGPFPSCLKEQVGIFSAISSCCIKKSHSCKNYRDYWNRRVCNLSLNEI